MAMHGCIRCDICGATCSICGRCDHRENILANRFQPACQLRRIFDLQEGLMREYQARTPDGIPEWPMDMAQKKAQKFMKETLSKCQDELAESKYLLKRAKEHRDEAGAPGLDLDEMLEEMVDALHFFAEACILLGVTSDELFHAYKKKNDVNLKRIDDEFGAHPVPDEPMSACCQAPVEPKAIDEYGWPARFRCTQCKKETAAP